MATRGARSRSRVKAALRRRVELGAGSLVLAATVSLPAHATLPPAAKVPLEERAGVARARLATALGDATAAPRPGQPLELAWWGNWHNWGWHPWWHNWPNWRNWHNWGNGPGAFAGCN